MAILVILKYSCWAHECFTIAWHQFNNEYTTTFPHLIFRETHFLPFCQQKVSNIVGVPHSQFSLQVHQWTFLYWHETHLQLKKKGKETILTCGKRWSSASPLIVPTARATKKVRRNLKHHWLMMGTKITPSKESRLMTVIEMIPQNQAVGRNEHRRVIRTTPGKLLRLINDFQLSFKKVTFL